MIVEKWLEKDCVCIVHQHDQIPRLVCGYVGVDAEHPLYGVRYNEETPILKEMLTQSKAFRKKHAVKEMLKGHSTDNWAYPMDDFSATPEGYFIKQGITFADKGDVANLKEFNCPAIWFFGFDSGHPGYEWETPTKIELQEKIHRLCFELAYELDQVKWGILLPTQDYKL